jgi:hypothetical protein
MASGRKLTLYVSEHGCVSDESHGLSEGNSGVELCSNSVKKLIGVTRSQLGRMSTDYYMVAKVEITIDSVTFGTTGKWHEIPKRRTRGSRS